MRSSTCGQIEARAGSPPAAEPVDLAGGRRRARPCPRPARRPGGRTSWSTAAARPSTSRRAAEEAGDLVDRADRRGQADALGRLVEQGVEPLEREREVRAALGAGDRVHLVDDHRLDAAQRLAGLRGEDQEQRLGRGDEDVGRASARTGAARRPGCRRCGSPTRDVGLGQPEPRRRPAGCRSAARAGCARRRRRGP